MSSATNGGMAIPSEANSLIDSFCKFCKTY